MYENFCNDVMELIDSIENGTEFEIINNAEKIHLIADYARGRTIYKETEARGNELFKDQNLVEIYQFMLQKIVDSPTSIHRDGAVILIIPYLSDKLKEAGY
jgi:hypothetical protein